METAKPADAPPLEPAAPKIFCANCGAELLGAHCYACGQPIKGMVRHLGSILHDVADTIFNIDSRIFRTLYPLYFKPGYLSNEYFAGRRVRYVTPFRLYFFLSVAAFLLIQVSLDSSLDLSKNLIRFDNVDKPIANAHTAAEVETRRDAALAELAKARASSLLPDEANKGLAQAEAEIRKQADRRLAKLAERDKAKTSSVTTSSEAGDGAGSNDDDSGAKSASAADSKAAPKQETASAPASVSGAANGAPPAHTATATKDATAAVPRPPTPPIPPARKESKDSDEDNLNFEFGNGKKWNPKEEPVQISWLPDFINAKLTNAAVHMVDNVPRIRKDPKPFLLGTFAVLPQVLFVLMPLFALLLKIFFIFKRRLYMEHLIVALHSHSFIFISLIGITLALLARSWVRTAVPWLEYPLGWLIFLMSWWLPIYLFLMQKRVYRQGWFFTGFKFWLIGTCYSVMITLGVVMALIVSLATT